MRPNLIRNNRALADGSISVERGDIQRALMLARYARLDGKPGTARSWLRAARRYRLLLSAHISA